MEKKRRLFSALLVIALIACFIPAMKKEAKAGQYDYPLTFDTQGGHFDSASGPSTKTISLSQSNLACAGECQKHTAYKDGYTFRGWYTAASGGTKITSSYRGYPSKVYAQWDKKTYTVTYNANGGSTPPSAQTKTHGVNLTLSSGKPTRTGYDFKGWATSKTGGVAYYAGGTYKNNSSITLYAVWAKKKYTITIYTNPGGQNGSAYTMTKEYGASVTIPSTTAPTGYYLAGYDTSTAATSIKYRANDTYSTNANLTLYPIFNKITYAVTYNANGGSNPPPSQTKTYGENLTLSTAKPTRTGYDFKGWATSPSGAVAYAAGATYTNNSAVTLYAVWAKKTYTITIYTNPGGQNGSTYTVTKYYGESVTIPSTTAPTGHYLAGYGIPGATTTIKYRANDTYSDNANLTLYPIFYKNTYAVTYNANGGTNPPAPQTKTYGETLTLTTGKPTRDGYDFGGWATSPNGAAVYGSGASYTNNSAVTLYAVWTKKKYTITIYTNPGEQNGSVYTMTKEHGASVTLPGTTAPRGYVFKGYDPDSTKTTPSYDCSKPNGLVYSDNKNVTLYPIFELLDCRVTFNANGGTNPPDSIAAKFGQEIVLPNVNAEREGYDFGGWSKTKNGSVIGKAGAKYKLEEENQTLYAVWSEKTYTVTLCNGNDHTPNPGSVYTLTKHYFSALELPPCSSVEGFTFTGYRNNSTGETYALGQKYTANANATLFATWDVSVYQIRLHYFDGAEEIVEVVEKTAGEPIVLPSPERINYIFRGWGDNESAVITYAPGAQYISNASADLYAKWEKLAIVASTDSVSLGINGCPAEDPVRVFLNAEFNGQLYFTVRSQFGATDWLHVELENKEVRISADPNTSGDTLRGATIVVSNGYGVECCIGVIQEGNFIRLVGENGVIEPTGNQVALSYDEFGNYNGSNKRPTFHVNTGIDNYTYEVKYKDGEESFVTIEKNGNQFVISCSNNEKGEREATLVIKSGSLERSYRIVQEAKTLAVTYRLVCGTQDKEIVRSHKYGTPVTLSASESGLPETVIIAGVEVPFVGWKSTKTMQLLTSNDPICEDTTCVAYYALIATCRSVDGQYQPIFEPQLFFAWNGGPRQFEGEVIEALGYRDLYENYILCYEYPKNPSLNDFALSENCNFADFTQGTYLEFGEVFEGEEALYEDRVKNASFWFGKIRSEERSTYLRTRLVSGKEEKIEIPFEDSRSQNVRFTTQCGFSQTMKVTQLPPRVENHGWDVRLEEYGISEDQFNDMLYFGGQTDDPNCDIEVIHMLEKDEYGYKKYTGFRLSYKGLSSYVATADDDVITYIKKEEAYKVIEAIGFRIGQLNLIKNDTEGINSFIEEINAKLDNMGDATGIGVKITEAGLELVSAGAEFIQSLSKFKVVKAINRFLAYVTFADLVDEGARAWLFRELNSDIDYYETIYKGICNAYGKSTAAYYTAFSSVTKGFMVKSSTEEVTASENGKYTFDWNKFYSIKEFEYDDWVMTELK